MIPIPLIKYLLDELEVPVSLEDLISAEATVLEAQVPNLDPIHTVRKILTAVNLRGLSCIQLGWRRFDLRRLPALALKGDRWYLVKKSGDTKYNDHLLLMDKSGVETLCSENEMQDAVVILVRAPQKKSSLELGSLRSNRAAQMILREIFRDRVWLPKVIIATVIVNIMAVFTSLFSMQVYDRVIPTMSHATLTALVVGMMVILALDWKLKIVRARILDSLAIAVDKRISQTVFEHLLHLRLDVQPKSLGTLSAQINGLDTIRQFFSAAVVFAITDLPFVLMFISMVAIIGGPIAYIYVALLPCALLLGIVAQWRLRRLMARQTQRQNERAGLLVDTIRGAESIRSTNSSWRFSEDWRELTLTIDRYSILQKSINNFTSLTTASITTIAYIGALVVGVWQVEGGALTVGGIIASSILGGRVIGPVSQFVGYLAQWENVKVSLSMLNQVLDLDQERRPGQNLLLPEELESFIELDKVRFAYLDSPIRQLDIDRLSFKAGDRVLLLGPIGCGKSTLMKLIAGLYPPSEGIIRLGDADLWELDPQIVSSNVSYLTQQVHLFKGTLRSNLALSGTSGDARLIKIARDLGIHEISASSSLGMELPVSEGGEGLSGGQRQLVALGRLIINQPKIWLLDEPTASLDTESESRVWQVLKDNVRSDDILIVATHRPLSALSLVNRVVLIKNGRIMRDGTPSEIIPQLVSRVTEPNRRASLEEGVNVRAV